jgi:dTDP-4-amino-4,6-dideoxygalactose transaminase
MPEAPGHHSNRWLTCATIDPRRPGADRDGVLDALAAGDIEARPVWKPMHLQPVFRGARADRRRGGGPTCSRAACACRAAPACRTRSRRA